MDVSVDAAGFGAAESDEHRDLRAAVGEIAAGPTEGTPVTVLTSRLDVSTAAYASNRAAQLGLLARLDAQLEQVIAGGGERNEVPVELTGLP